MDQKDKTKTGQRLRVLIVFGCTAVLMCSGCPDLKEDDPDPTDLLHPPKILHEGRDYLRVSISPSEVTLDLSDFDPSSGRIPAAPPVLIKGSHAGFSLGVYPWPPQNFRWRISESSGLSGSYVKDPQNVFSTELVIQYDPAWLVVLAQAYDPMPLWEYIIMKPIAPGYLYTGQRRLDIRVLAPHEDMRAAVRPGSARLKVKPDKHRFTPPGSQIQHKSFTLQNTGGQELEILQVSFSGSGSDAALFSLFSSPTLPYVLVPGELVFILVECAALTDIRVLHSATMLIHHDNGITNVALNAYRNF